MRRWGGGGGGLFLIVDHIQRDYGVLFSGCRYVKGKGFHDLENRNVQGKLSLF